MYANTDCEAQSNALATLGFNWANTAAALHTGYACFGRHAFFSHLSSQLPRRKACRRFRYGQNITGYHATIRDSKTVPPPAHAELEWAPALQDEETLLLLASLVFPLGSKVFRPSSALSLAGIFTKQEMWIGNSHCGQLVVGFHPGGNFLKSPMTLRLCQRTACQMQDEVPGLPRRSTPLQSRAFTVKIHGLQAAFFQHSVLNAEHYMFMAHQKAA